MPALPATPLATAESTTPSPAVIRQATAIVGGSADAYQRVWDARRNGKGLKLAVDDGMVDAYYDTAEKMADYVDTLRR